MPAITQQTIERFALFTLTDKAERDDHCAHIYNKSLLYLVSHAFEKKPRIPLFREGIPILGLARSIEEAIAKEDAVKKLFDQEHVDWVQAPNNSPQGSVRASRSSHHGDFDDDEHTLQATLARILAQRETNTNFVFQRSSSGLRKQRLSIVQNEES